MALDAATLELTARELKTVLADAKIAKLFEPTRDELVITLRTRTDTYALLLSARSGSARVCLTEETFENPETPPSFCMLMRKHLTGGKLLDVHMEPGDRIVYFDFQCTNEMGDLVRNTLCAELMGRYSNLVLVQNGKIIDALKRVDFEDSDIRQLLPGLTYTTPPKPARPDFLQVSSASIVAAACQRDLPVADALNKTVAGVGPVVCREAAWRAFDGEHLLANELTEEQKRSLMAAIDELKELHDKGGCPCSANAKLAIAPKARCSAFPDSQRPVTLAPPCEATQRLTGANAAVLRLAPTVSTVPDVARRRLRRGTADAACTTPPLRGWGECDNAGCRFSSGRSAW